MPGVCKGVEGNHIMQCFLKHVALLIICKLLILVLVLLTFSCESDPGPGAGFTWNIKSDVLPDLAELTVI